MRGATSASAGIRCFGIGRGRVWLKIRQLVRLGAPAAGQILLEVGAWNLATFSAGWLSPVQLATHQIALNYAALTYMVPLGISAAAAVSVGHAIGAGDPARARRAGWLALALGTAFMLSAAVVFLVAPRPLIALYTRDPRVMAVGPSLLWIAAAFQIFDGIQTVSTGALRGLGETRGAHGGQLCWLLDPGAAAGVLSVFCVALGDLRAVDRAYAGAGGDCDFAAGAVEAGFGKTAISRQPSAFSSWLLAAR